MKVEKIIIMLRCALCDGDNNTVGLSGLNLAIEAGISLAEKYGDSSYISKGFSGPLVQSLQTLQAVCYGLGRPLLPSPIVPGLGDEDLFRQIANEQFMAAIRKGESSFRAVCLAHSREKIEDWAAAGRIAILSMFEELQEGEIGLAISHEPVIQLAAFGCDIRVNLRGWDRLGHMEGYLFSLADNGLISVREKISFTKNKAAPAYAGVF